MSSVITHLRTSFFAILLIAASFFLHQPTVKGQSVPELIDSRAVIQAGIAFHDNEEYNEAIAEYDKVTRFDTNYVWAIYEKSMTYYKMEKFQESERCARIALAREPDYVQAMTTLGNALDEQGRLDEAIAIYDEGIKKYPYNHLLWINKGILYEGNDQYDKAFETYKQLIEFNPMFASSHLRLGMMCFKEGHVTQGILSLTAFLMLEPVSNRSLGVLSWLNQTSSGGNKDLGSAETKVLPNDMADIDFLVNNKVALNKKYKVPSKLDFNIVKQTHLVFEQTMEQPGSGYWWDLYVPLFQEIMKQDKFEAFSLYLAASSSNTAAQKRITKKLSDVKAFQSWYLKEWRERHNEYNLDGRDVSAFFYDNSALLAFADEAADGSIVGDVIYYYATGTKKSFGNINDKGNRDGQWVFLYESGDTSQIAQYKDGEVTASYTSYHENGEVDEIGNYKDGKLHGPLQTFHKSGNKYIVGEYVEGKMEGEAKRYYSNGQVQYEYNQKEGELHGSFKNYYWNGNVNDEKTFEEGNLEGERKQYYENGQLSHIQNYVEGNLEGEYKTYHINGQLDSEGMAAKGNVAGDWKYYYSDGKLREKSSFGENGKVTGSEESYAYDGKILHKREYQKGDLQRIETYDVDGKLIYEADLSKGEIYVKNYANNRTIMNEGLLKKSDYSGEWKFYYSSGQLSQTKTYEEGLVQGEVVYYYPNGEVKYRLNYEDNMAEGPYELFSPQGKVTEAGNYHEDERWGIWRVYYAPGVVETEAFYSNGSKTDEDVDYWFNGNRKYMNVYDDEGTFVASANYDTTGKLIDTSFIEFGNGKLHNKYANGKLSWEGSYLDGLAHGKFAWYYPTGQMSSGGMIEMDNRVGEWVWYHVDGKVREKGSYENGYRHGVWTQYNPAGVATYIRTYAFGEEHGLVTSNYETGEKEYEIEYYEDERHGESRYYAPTGELKIVRYYNHGMLIGYSYMDASKKIKPMIPVENGSADIVAYYPNGQKSVEYSIVNEWFQGKFTHYNPEGKIIKESTYLDDELHGERKSYHTNGKLWVKETYHNGVNIGKYESYHSNGKPRLTGNYKLGNAHGVFTYYNAAGKKTHTLLYNSGTIVSGND